MLVASDEITDKSWEALARGKGDGFMVAGATLYGISKLSSISSSRNFAPDVFHGVSKSTPSKLPKYNLSTCTDFNCFFFSNSKRIRGVLRTEATSV